MQSQLPVASPAHNDRRLFYAHVGAVVATTAVVASLLLGVTSIPAWFSVACCAAIAIIAIAFVAVAVNNFMTSTGHRVFGRAEGLITSVALATLQVIFVLPVLICVFAPTFRG